MKQSNAPFIVEPRDEHNQALLANVHPTDWVNPTPSGRYNLVVIGAGTAGLVSAAGAAGLGAKVALVERSLMGGDCLNIGCVPSKLLIRSARAAANIRQASSLGISAAAPEVHFEQVMERLRSIRAGISSHDSASRFKSLGVDVFIGDAKFESGNSIRVADSTLQFSRAVIATGGRARIPDITGLAEAGFLTNETVFNLTELPARLAVIGGGPIGCELAQAFQRLGSAVTILGIDQQFLPREDPEAAKILETALKNDGLSIKLGAETQSVSVNGSGKTVHYSIEGREESMCVDQILVAVGRTANVEGLGTEIAGVDTTKHGISIDDFFKTSNPHIFAAGDCCMKWKFTHAADFAARAVIQNALFFGRKRLSSLLVPWATYTDPEIAHVGLYEKDAERQGIKIDTFKKPLAEVDRAKIDLESEGFVKIHVKHGTDRILGATIVAAHAGDLISEVTLAMTAGVGLGSLANVIHPYPTQAESIRHTGDLYNRTRLTPGVKTLFKTLLRFRR